VFLRAGTIITVGGRFTGEDIGGKSGKELVYRFGSAGRADYFFGRSED
jgi:hypothetical protein